MLKIYCEGCKGKGKITQTMSMGYGTRGMIVGPTEDCPKCQGKGYTECDPFAELKEKVKSLKGPKSKGDGSMYSAVQSSVNKICDLFIKIIEEQEKKHEHV